MALRTRSNIACYESHGIAVGQIHFKVLDARTARSFREAMKPLLQQNTRLVLDMSAVEVIESGGLNTLVSCLRQAHAIGGEIKLASLRSPVRAVFQLVRMHHVFEVYNDIDEAIRSYAELQP